jgi:hypothetical protein
LKALFSNTDGVSEAVQAQALAAIAALTEEKKQVKAAKTTLAVAEAAVQQHDRRPVAERRVPDARAVVFEPSLRIGRRQRRAALCVEADEIVVVEFRIHRSAVLSRETSLRL